MFSRSIIRLTLALIIVAASLLLVTSITATAAAPTTDARPSADLIVNPGESIQAAIDAANDGDTIIVNAGDYTESLTLSKPVSLTGVNSDTTILHAVAGQRVLTVTGATVSNSVVISGLTFTGGSADYGGGMLTGLPVNLIGLRFVSNTAIEGGGLYIGTTSATISNCHFENNFASGDYGGGIETPFGTLSINRTKFISNTSNNSGGAFHAYAAVVLESQFERNSAMLGNGAILVGNLTLSSSQFINNRCLAAGCEAGAVGVWPDTTTPRIIDTTFTGNSALGRAGALYVKGSLLVTRSDFISNTASNFGGGLYADGLATINDSQFLHNSASSGGGMWAGGASLTGGRFEGNVSASGIGGGLSTGPLTMSSTQFVSNTAMCGGGAFAINPVEINGGRFERNTSNGSGGALCLSAATLTGTEFISNTAADSGGGLYASDAVTLTNVEFISNTAQQNGGGAFISGTTTITNSHFLSNTAEQSGGGALLRGYAQIIRTNLENNHAFSNGGGLMCGLYDDHNALMLSNTSFISNSATWNGGGLVANADVVIDNGRFINNEVTGTMGVGGAVLINGTSMQMLLVITGTQFLGNLTSGDGSDGGAIYYNSDGVAHITNTVFAGNSAREYGAVLVLNGRNYVSLIHSSMADHSLNPLSAITLFNGASINITNTVITSHTKAIERWSGFITEDYNLFYNNTTLGFTKGAHSLIGDPRFVDPAHDDYHLAFGSAAIDRGVDAGVYTDLDGHARPIGPGFDIGAYEYQLANYIYLPLIQK